MFMIQRHFISFHENLPEHLRQLSSYHVMVARVKMSWQLFCLSFLKAALWSGRRWIQRQFELFAIISTCSVSWGKCFPPDLTLDGQIARSERRHLPMQGPLEFVLQNGIRQGFFKWSILWFPRRNATCSINPAFSAFWFRYPSCFLVSVDIVNAGLLCFFQSELFHEQLFLVLTVFCTMFYLLPSCFSFFKFPHAVLLGPWAVCMSCTLAVGEPESATHFQVLDWHIMQVHYRDQNRNAWQSGQCYCGSLLSTNHATERSLSPRGTYSEIRIYRTLRGSNHSSM